MSELEAAGALTRFILRRDRVRIAMWLVAFVVLVLTTAAAVKGLFPTQHDLDVAAAASEDNPVALAFNGPALALNTVGGQVAFQLSSFGFLGAGLMGGLMMSRLTRGEEDSGRLELIRSMPVGRHAPLAASAVVVGGMEVVLGIAVTVSLLAVGLPAVGSVVLGAGFTVVGLVFSAIAALLAQVAENPRVVSGSVGAVLGLSYVLRAIGDMGDGTVSWLSPIGWGQKARPYAGEQWWPLLFCIVVAGAIALAAFRLATRRDFGAGLIPPRAGRPVAARSLLGPLRLAFRLQRGVVLWWGVSIVALAVVYGSLANTIEDFVADNDAVSDMIARATGVSLVDSYLATSLLTTALIASGCAVQVILRLRSEETDGRAEPVLATALSRSGWLSTHAGIAVGGTALIVAMAGIGLGATYAIVIGDADQVPRLLAAAVAYLPAIAVVAGIAVALFGLLPRWASLAWVTVGVCFVLSFFGELVGIPSWVMGLSPFERTPLVPASDLDLVPLAVMTAIAGGLFVAGYAGFRRRDVPS